MAKSKNNDMDLAKKFAEESGIDSWALVHNGKRWEMIKISANVKPVAVLTASGWK
ncbi:MAG: hypothetical protein HKN05_18125 [Rhizobiales bacterium]|nr:hypothetical protein [Hyphomicrobiales bacterium]